MGKRVKKKARNAIKEKRVPTSSPKAVPQEKDNENQPTTETVENGVPVEKERSACVHFDKALDLAQVSSKLGSAESLSCEDCRDSALDRRSGKGKGKHGKKKGASEPKADSKATWVCLQCGHFSCGGVGLPNNPQCHALRHARQRRHPLVFQVENPHLRWCFFCSTLLPVDNGEQGDVLSDIVKLLKKPSPKASSLDVEDVWFGSGSATIDYKLDAKEVHAVSGKGSYAVRGLVNLGNTCFFNSVLQNLLSMDILREHFLMHDGTTGPLSSAMRKIFVETSIETGQRITNPRSLFGCVCAKAPQFRGFQQQDSHELLRCLLDGLSTEESSAKKSNRSSPEDEESRPGNPTFVDSIFGGQLSSTVQCVECGHSSVVYEPFLDLSLPLPSKKPPAKKAPPASRMRKTKLPPKRVGRTRPKLNKDGDSAPVLSTCSPSTSSESSTGLKGALVSCSSSAQLVESANVVEDNGCSTSQNCDSSSEQVYSSRQIPQAGEQEGDGFSKIAGPEPASKTQSVGQENDGLAWLDYLDSVPLLDDQDLAAENKDIPVSHDFGSLNVDSNAVIDTANSSGEASVQPEDQSRKSESTADDWQNELPKQVQDNEVLLLTYKEDSPAVEGMFVEAETSGPVGGGEDTLGFDGLGDLFNEPEVEVSTTSVVNNQNGFSPGNCSESDPDEVDDTNSPVSIESCLAHFVKPELLSGEHAWHCENCSKLAVEEKRKRKRQLKRKSVVQTNEFPNSEALQSSESSPDCSASFVAFHNNGSCKPDDNLNELDTRQTINSSELQEEQESCKAENHLSASAGPGSADEASLNGKSIDSHGELCNHVPAEELSGVCDKQDSGEDEDVEVDSKSVKVMRDAKKRILINKAPPILTIHLKRFGQDARGRLSKLNGHVGFQEIIDLQPYLDRRSSDTDNCIYHLTGVVVHSGSMRSGHYIAYFRGSERQRGRSEEENGHRRSVWYYASDAHVRETTLEEVFSCEAYLLFYEKVKP